MNIAADLIAFAPHHQRDLGMHLQARPVRRRRARPRFPACAPTRCCSLRRSAPSIPPARPPACRSRPLPARRRRSVSCVPTRYSVVLIASTLGSLAARAEELHHRLERFVGMVQQNVFPFDHRIQILLALGDSAGGITGTNGLSFRSGRSREKAGAAGPRSRMPFTG